MFFRRSPLEDYISTLPGLLTTEVTSSSQMYGAANGWSLFERKKLSAVAIIFYSTSFVIIQPIMNKVMNAVERSRGIKIFNDSLVLDFDFSRISTLDTKSSFEMFSNIGVEFKKQLDDKLNEGVIGRDAYLDIAKEFIHEILDDKGSAASDSVISRHVDRSIFIYQQGLKLK